MRTRWFCPTLWGSRMNALAPQWWLPCAVAGAGLLVWPARAHLTLVRAHPRGVRSPSVDGFDPTADTLLVLESMCTMLRAGSPADHALRLAVEPLLERVNSATELWLKLVETACADGDVPAVWEQLAQEWNAPTLTDVAAAWRLSARYGCPLADAMEAAATNIRAHREHRAVVRSAVAGARATVGVLVGLPVLGLAIGALLGVNLWDVYLGRSGWVTFWPGIGLIALGMRWVNRQTRHAVQPPRAEESP